MKRLLIGTTAVSLGLVVLLATTGVSMYSHYCNLTHSGWVGIFIPDDCCAHTHPASHQADDGTGHPDNCCETDAHTAPDTGNSAGPADTGNCCTTEKKEFKLDSVFHPSGNITLDQKITQVIVCEFHSRAEMPVEETSIGFPDLTPPPPLSGKELVHFLHQSKIPLPC